MRRRHVFGWLATSLLLLVPTVHSRDQQGERRIVLVNALDREGRYVSDLNAANFKGEFRGLPVEILSATEDATPRRIAMLVDVSASQEEAGGLPWRLAEQLVEDLTPKHTIAVFTIGETVEQHSDFTSDRDRLRAVMRVAGTIRPTGNSALYDGVVQAAMGFAGPTVGEVVCLFSDGRDTSSTMTKDRLIDVLAAMGLRAFFVATASAQSARPGLELGWRTITDATGGAWFWASRRNADATIRDVSSRITRTYRLDLGLPRPVDRPRDWKLEGIGAAGSRSLRVVYPHRLAPVRTSR